MAAALDLDFANNWAKWDAAHKNDKGGARGKIVNHDTNEAGGIRNARSKKAIEGFQKRWGLKVTGTLDVHTKRQAAKVAAAHKGDTTYQRADAVNALAHGNRRAAGTIIIAHDRRLRTEHQAKRKATAAKAREARTANLSTPYVLKDTIDLSRHKPTGWMHEKRGVHGRWTSGPAALLKGAAKDVEKGGKHSRYHEDTRNVADNYHSDNVLNESTMWKSVNFEGLMDIARQDPSATRREHAQRELTMHLTAMSEQMKKTQVHESGKVVHTSSTKSVARITTKAKPVVAKVAPVGKREVKETALRVRDDNLTHAAVAIGARVAASATALIGASESERFVEAFHKITENGLVEAGINAAIAALVTALVVRLQKAWRNHKDSKIAKARGEV